MNRLIRSSALTWALGYVLLGLAALGAFAVVLWYAWNVTIYVAREEILRDDAQRLTERFDRDGVAGLTAYLDARVGMQIAGERTLLLTDAAHHRLAGNIAAWPRGVPDQPGTHAVLLELDGKPTRMLLVRTPLPGGYQLLVGRDLAFFVPLEIRFTWGLIAAVTFLCVVGIAGAILMRRQLLSRVEGIRQTVAAIMQGDLRRRLAVGPGGGELDTLSQTLNGMLDHIEYLIRGEAQQRAEDTHDTIDSGARRSGFVRVDAAAVAAEVVEFYEPAAEQKGVAFSFEAAGDAAVAGDPVLLAQALSNLIDNSLKSVSERGAISVRVGRRADGAVEIAVADDGPGIADADKPRAAERFFRGDRSRASPGVGLGLSIVDAVAKLHGGVLQLLDNHPGLLAQMVLPVTAAPPGH